jgi:hypothetical protein
MKKIAIYVEGQTEQIFVTKLIKEIANKNHLTIKLEKLYGGKTTSRRVTSIEGTSLDNADAKFYVLVRDCGGDSRVKSDIIDNIEKHKDNNFSKIIGLLDVYPKYKSDLKKLMMYSQTGIPTKFIPFSIIYAVMEIEAWFIAEVNHFIKISDKLTKNVIEHYLGHELDIDSIENIHNPASVLNDIYQLSKISYHKNQAKVNKVVDALDYENIYLNLREQIESLNSLISDIDEFLVE